MGVAFLHAHTRLEKRDGTIDSTFEIYDVNNTRIMCTFIYV